ncbi:MAG: glycoside hydrolase family 25 [Oscillospiraceae bacterium]|nr:glycoside hydrolase family 25 [Oscillospiraceae bacterium]MCR4761693.1 glycoside hydrolase family 25 [Oscillospiraceae bacterium]
MNETKKKEREQNGGDTSLNPSNRKKKRWLLFSGILLLAATAAFLMFREGVLWFNMPSAKKYPVRGVDASHYQGQMDWDILAQQGITFAFLKATEGSGTVDDCFADNWKNARAAGLYVGAYHFFSFDSSAVTQAENYCTVVPADADALPPVIDLEFYRSENLPETAEVQENLRIMLESLRSFYGKKPIIYTTKSCWETYLQDTEFDYTLWIRSIFTKPSDDYQPAWTFWQYNPRGILDGYTGGEMRIDLNVFRGNMNDFRAFSGYQTAPGTPE